MTEPAAQTAIPPALALVEQSPRAAGLRDIRVVQDSIPVLDTARFEHMQRIASVMADSTLCPDALCMTREGDSLVRLPDKQVLANCFLVTNQAVRWGMDPFAVAQCVSVVHGKLCYEGKLIAAVLDAKLGVKLSYRFDGCVGEKLGVVVVGTIPGQVNEETVEGDVAAWKTTGKNSPWLNPANHKRQLRYRGAREWARAHAPAVLLGVYSQDEMDDLNIARMRDITPPAARLQAAEAPPPPSAISAPKPAATVAQPDIQPVAKQTEPAKQSATGEAPAPPKAFDKPSKKTADKPAKLAANPATKPDIQPDKKPLPSALTATLQNSLAVLENKEEEPVPQFNEEKFFADLQTKLANADDDVLNNLGAHIDGHKEVLSLTGHSKARDMYWKRKRELMRG